MKFLIEKKKRLNKLLLKSRLHQDVKFIYHNDELISKPKPLLRFDSLVLSREIEIASTTSTSTTIISRTFS